MNRNKIARIFYNLIAPAYDYFFGAKTPRVREMRKRIIKRLELKPGDAVLEIGVGTGANIPHIHNKIEKIGKIFGIDISEGMIRKCRDNLEKEGIEAELILGNAESLPYKDNSFDAVLHFGSINFISDKQKAIKEAIRVAKPGAKIVLGDEIFPFVGSCESVEKLIPKKAKEVFSGTENALISFWIIELRKIKIVKKKKNKIY